MHEVEGDHGEPDDEHDLRDRAGVPADDGDRRLVGIPHVPAHQRRECEDEAREPGQPLAGAPDPRCLGCEAVFRLDVGLLRLQRLGRLHGLEYQASAALEAEELLDLAPDDDREVGAQDDQDQENGPETQAREAALPHPFLAGSATSAMGPIPTIDRAGIVRGRVLDDGRAPGRLGHPGTINGCT